jgi:hypothetical protein
MAQPQDKNEAQKSDLRNDYFIWTICSLFIFAGLAFIPYEEVKSGLWQDLVWLVRGRRPGNEGRAAGVGLLISGLAFALGWVVHLTIVEKFGRWTSRPLDQASDYDDKPPTL